MNAQEWIGRERDASESVSIAMVEGLRATLPLECDDPVPYGVHWLVAQPRVPARDVGVDGHPQLGVLLPPVGEGRRMWAASAVEFVAPLRPGDMVHRRSTVLAITRKAGRSGPLTFVEVGHEDRVDGAVAIRERQTIVYRGGPTPPAPAGGASVATDDWPFRRSLTPDAVMLFRYSALTFNGHRIHYDHPYATVVEGYPGLVVHAPLIATMLLDLVRCVARERRVTAFSFRGASPAIVDEVLLFEARASGGGTVELRARTPGGRVVSMATASTLPSTSTP